MFGFTDVGPDGLRFIEVSPNGIHKVRHLESNQGLRAVVQYSRLTRGLQEIVDGHSAHVKYADCYFDAYQLVLGGRGEDVRALVVDLLTKLSRARVEDFYYERCQEFENIIMYCERTYAVKHSLKPIKIIARQLYDRPVAARWRKVRLCALWHRRFREWFLLYEHARFVPDGPGAAAAQEEFYALSS
jgi:hypothetical protein